MELCQLPEDLIAYVLSMTSPRDAYMMCLVSSTFSHAAQLDIIWDRFLSSDYLDIISRSSNGSDFISSFASKKDLYTYLCRNFILIDNGTKSFSLDKVSGKKCYMLGARDLVRITFHGDKWRWKSLAESRFPKVVEVEGHIRFYMFWKIENGMLSPNTSYSTYFVFTTTPESYIPSADLYYELQISGHETRRHTLLTSLHMDPNDENLTRRWNIIDQRADGWREFKTGEFFVEEGKNEEVKIKLTVFFRHKCMIVQGIDIRPN